MSNLDGLIPALGAALREIRREQGITQEALSLTTGVHRNYVGGIERGEREPTVTVIARLADALDCKTSRIFRDAERIQETGSRTFEH